MADINTSGKPSSQKGTGVKKLQKQSTRVDLTPMVDLGFLLITFFIFTTSMSEPKAMNLVVPDDKQGADMPITSSGALTILLDNNQHYYYEGEINKEENNLERGSLKDLRMVIMNKKKQTPPENLFVTIKAGDGAVYKDIVEMLDEMLITDIKRYALVDLSKEEQKLIENFVIE